MVEHSEQLPARPRRWWKRRKSIPVSAPKAVSPVSLRSPSRVLPMNVFDHPHKARLDVLTTLRPGAPFFIYRVAPGEYDWTAIPAEKIPSEAMWLLNTVLVEQGTVEHPWGNGSRYVAREIISGAVSVLRTEATQS